MGRTARRGPDPSPHPATARSDSASSSASSSSRRKAASTISARSRSPWPRGLRPREVVRAVFRAGRPLPAAMRAQVQALNPGLADYMDLQSRMRAGMSRISVRERAFATMTVDVLYQTLQESFRAHVGRALGAGATPAEVRAAVRVTATFGMTRTWRALNVFDALLAEREGRDGSD